MKCCICPRNCGADRRINKGFCGMGELPCAAKAYLHPYEEPIVSGTRGSGTVFFSGCNLKCCYCQNYAISHEKKGAEVTEDRLAELFLSLQSKGAHNINLVNPTHFTVQIMNSIKKVKSSMTIPFIWNSSGYERTETLMALEGLIEVYLPDLKYVSSNLSSRYSDAGDYFDFASQAILEMYRQVGGVKTNEQGLIEKGLIIRHLILPNASHDSVKVLEWIRENIPDDAYISLMGQYTPTAEAAAIKGLDRRITKREYEMVLDKLRALEMENGFVQDLDSADLKYTPDFDLSGL